ncbi:MAG: hypothetical protein KAX49_04945 [Halanaerobiales bacterium]|nr:hypothetical protein [Halanaerobiales bacterium]
MQKTLVIVLLGVIGFAFMLTVIDMPNFGELNGPAWQGSATSYLTKSKEETRTLNVISAILIDYRAYDTLIETTVLFTATVGVLALAYGYKKKKEEE